MTDVLVRIEHMMEDASRALPVPNGEVSELPSGSEAFASATSGSAPPVVRGN